MPFDTCEITQRYCPVWATTNAGFRSHVFLTLGATVSFCQRLCVVTDANNVGKTPKFLSSSTATLFLSTTPVISGRRNNSSQDMTTEKTTSSCQSRPTTHNYSQLINLHIRHVIQQTLLQKHRLQPTHFRLLSSIPTTAIY